MRENGSRLLTLGCGCVYDRATGLYYELCDRYAEVIDIEDTVPKTPAREKVEARDGGSDS